MNFFSSYRLQPTCHGHGRRWSPFN